MYYAQKIVCDEFFYITGIRTQLFVELTKEWF